MKKRPSRLSRPNAVRWSWVAATLAVTALVPPVAAQSWNGSASLGVQVRGSGGPVEGALVEIRNRRSRSIAGPEARRTDAKGQANFVGISPGAWSLEITHPDYLSFVASVRLEAGRKPEILSQFLEASGPGRNTFKVKFLRSDRSLGTAVPGTATHEITEPPSAVRQRSAAVPAAPAPPPRERVAARPDPAPQPRQPESGPPPAPPEPPAGEPADEPASAPQGEALGPTAAANLSEAAETGSGDSLGDGAPAAEPAAQPTPPLLSEQPPAPAPPESQAAPEVPATPPPPAPEPTIEPDPNVEAPSVSEALEAPEDPDTVASPESDGSSVTAFGDRTCFDCKPGEWAVTAQVEVPAGEPCRPPTEVAVRRAMRDVAAVSSTPLAAFAGPLPADLDRPPLSLASGPARGTLARYLSGSESCRLVAIVIPAGGSFAGFRLEAHDQRGSGDCTGDQECEILDARFLFRPAVARGEGATIVYSVFENTGPELRRAEMTGFFLPPAGWSPD